MKRITGLLLVAVLLIGCGGTSTSTKKAATTTAARTTTTQDSMSLAEAYCSDLGKGMSPLQIWGGVKADWPDVGEFAYRAYVWVKRKCPSELKSNELLRYWLENWDINPDS